MIYFDFTTSIRPISDELYFKKVITFVENWENGIQEIIIKTSGSTGIPKSISLSRMQMVASSKLTAETFNLKAGNHVFCCLNIDFIGGMMMLVRAIENKLQLTVIEPVSDPFLNVHSALKIDFLAVVPLQMQAILDHEFSREYLTNNSGLKNIIIGGAAINNHLLTKIEALKIPTFATYGMTETVSHIAIKKLNGPDKSEFFRPLKGIELKKNNNNCLLIKGICTAQIWVETNDIVELNASGLFKLLGRANRVVNSGGVKIYLDLAEKELETEIQNIFGKAIRFFLFGEYDEKFGEKLLLCIEAENPEILYHVKDVFKNSILDKYKLPKELVFVPNFIETDSGKINFIKTIKKINNS